MTAEEILREFVTDVKLAYGTGNGDEINAVELDWPDLHVTYRKAIGYFDPVVRVLDMIAQSIDETKREDCVYCDGWWDQCNGCCKSVWQVRECAMWESDLVG